MANLFLYHAEPRAARGIPLVLNAAARGQEVLREGHARLGRGAGVAEPDCWSDGERKCQGVTIHNVGCPLIHDVLQSIFDMFHRALG